MATVPQAVRVRDLVLERLPPGKDRDMVLRWIEPRARRAQARVEKAGAVRANPVAKALGRIRSEAKGARAEADAAFSEFIRIRDSVVQPDFTRVGKCCTCGKAAKVGGLGGLQCGHWIPRGQWGTRYDERNAHGQCYGCNSKLHGAGRMDAHQAYIASRYGEHIPEVLRVSAKLSKRKPGAEELRQIASKYRVKAQELLQREGGR